MSARTIQAIRGMNDILPDESHLWEFFEETVRDWLRAYGYRNIRTPVLEQTDLFVRSIGAATDIVEKEMYTFVDELNGENLALRPEGTAACVRAVIEHNLLYSGPQRLWYWGPMFRHERPQKGRYRQFFQVGAEALGFAGPDVDAEHLVMCARLWRTLGLDGIELDLNTLGDSEARVRYRARLVKYLQRHDVHLDGDSRRRLHSNPLRVLDSKNPALQELIAGAPRLADDLDENSIKAFDELQALLRDAGVSFRINPRLVRGLDYYNGAVYEWVSGQLGAQNAVCAGGRYDGLVEQIGGKPAPACGFAMGVERLLVLVKDGVKVGSRAPDVYLVRQGELAERFGARVAEALRDAGLHVLLHCGGGSFKSQMRKADASQARFAVIVGDDEAGAGVVSLKPLREAAQQMRVRIDEAVRLIKR
ncbi:MAG: histidine--tRNA ligase [Betaproteobacteria bacterium]|nr:histidine--tRNA ligase [Betaproteobacteria bacterium]MDH3438989.1 histidine--tRNA ligase [Betaproteobacteria bacterium]